MSRSAHDEQQAALPLTPDERAFRASLEGLVDFYRVEQTTALWRAFWPPALIFLPLGSVLTALAMTNRFVSGGLQGLCVACALAVTALGPVWAIASLLRSIRRDDRYLAIFVDGLRIRLDAHAEPRRIGWDELSAVECDARVLRLWFRAPGAEGLLEAIEITHRFSGLTLQELGSRVRHGQRLGRWGRLSRETLAGAV